MMKLHDLFRNIIQVVNILPDIDIIGITSDSRKVKRGYLFVALSFQGNNFIGHAIERGAAAVLSNVTVSESRAVSIQYDDPKRIYHKLAARFYPLQPKNIAAVTGTNGKTSVVNFYQQLLDCVGVTAASIGTVGVKGVKKQYDIKLTTPDAIDMHYILHDLALQNVEYVAVEASSHALDQHRIDSVKVKVAAFTNLSQDHFDYHHDLYRYFKVKQRLFTEVLDADGVMVLNADIPEYQVLKQIVGERKIITYGQHGQEVRLIKQVPHSDGQVLLMNVNGNEQEVFLPILGKFQIHNILCAIGMALGIGISTPKIEKVQAVEGRMQLIKENHYRVVIDYAHTPDALKMALISLRWHNSNFGKIILVFGCGGDRDRGKRALMGKIANDYADIIIVCDDNPRNENPDIIRKDIISSCHKAIEIGDRKQAIITAINMAEMNDMVLIAGKGHEKKQILSKSVISFNDYLVVYNLLFGR